MSVPESPPTPGERSRRFHDLGLRAASAAVLVPVALGALAWGGLVWAVLLVLLFAGLMWEWAGLSRHIVSAARPRFLLAGVVYAAVPGAALAWLRDRPGGLIDVLFLLVVVWMTDIGAYAVGRLAGGPKLAPAISPGKTVSGAVGGLVIGVAAGLLVARSPAAILPGAIISIVSQAGDLAESALKRRLGVKDSGRTIPGHGGLFDRLDGVLAAAPVAAVLALLAQGGVPLWR
ncbi:MAG: phosphatidate cytidylyltransferase [Rhodospirillales bacterium]|uniref:phosphatidate cytidylyltransferase n=1 Tax=Acidiphilium TaxID=522 RepID=UPI001F4BE052|nr:MULTISPECIES: phosphatidate cytidylyltransferase [Acidiphilium]MBU6357004.1 phosphatidate cytidylyltransferase [Rhodospirillales bacterium]MDE2327908.1 phosphatidate cytidylyltransferase [Rhodospirillales bacterium]UNC14183.1 phosphatidate cytidylyltransferase [Acidiphilium multivorum]